MNLWSDTTIAPMLETVLHILKWQSNSHNGRLSVCVRCSSNHRAWHCKARDSCLLDSLINLLTLASDASFLRTPLVDPYAPDWSFPMEPGSKNNFLFSIWLEKIKNLLKLRSWEFVDVRYCDCSIFEQRLPRSPVWFICHNFEDNWIRWGLQDWLYIRDIFNYMKQFEGVAYFNSFSQINRRNQIKFSRFSY